VSALASTGCATVNDHKPRDRNSDHAGAGASIASHPFVRMQRSGTCWGPCPDYKVDIDDEGKVSYLGGNYVMTHGPATGRVSSYGLGRLRDAIAELRRVEIPRGPCWCGCPTDTSSVALTTWNEGVPRTVSYDEGCKRVPAPLHQLELEIDRAAERWVGTHEARDACFVEQRDCTALVGWPEPSP